MSRFMYPGKRLKILLSAFSLVTVVGFLILIALPLHAQEGAYKHAKLPYTWSFPEDHGAHPGYQTEWWYYTGQLYAPEGIPFRDTPKYGFQLTFFRRALRGGTDAPSLYLAHGVLTRLSDSKVIFNSRLADESLGIGQASHNRLEVLMADWSAEEIAGEHILKFSVIDTTDNSQQRERIQVRLRLIPDSARILLQGDNGFSKKGECSTCASLYYSLPRMTIRGEVYTETTPLPRTETVHGLGWMDHEIMTNALSEDQLGWDWMGLMFKDGRHLTIFQLRTKQGEPFRSANLCEGEKCSQLSSADFTLSPELENAGSWTSPKSKATYPTRWRIVIPSAGINHVVQARVPSSELVPHAVDEQKSEKGRSLVYWEGPVATKDESVLGYLEMTGYLDKIQL